MLFRSPLLSVRAEARQLVAPDYAVVDGDQPGTPALTPVPQELIAAIEARFRTTDISLPDA